DVLSPARAVFFKKLRRELLFSISGNEDIGYCLEDESADLKMTSFFRSFRDNGHTKLLNGC
ncbi:MAG: hypothetical protein ABL876_12425, partial [Chitinophagaceae bacterium]